MTSPDDATLAKGERLVRILFWNVNNKPLVTQVSSLIKDTNADAVVLLENGSTADDTLTHINHTLDSVFDRPEPAGSPRFHCYRRTASLSLQEFHSTDRLSFRKLYLGSTKAILVLVHGLDQRNHDSLHRQEFASDLSSELQWVKGRHSEPILLLGDFNMNPFDSGMWLPTCLNAMPTVLCTSRKSRTYRKSRHEFYYNPMWGFLGDRHPDPPGTTYDTSSQGLYGWNLFDQAILHHSLVPFFRGIDILTTAGDCRLHTKDGRPNKQRASDHFPILLTMGIERNG